jgi:hypothetical protein
LKRVLQSIGAQTQRCLNRGVSEDGVDPAAW